MDKTKRREQKQPKISVLIVASSGNKKPGETIYLMQQRLRNPLWGYWSIIGGPVRWGEAIEAAAATNG